MTHQDRLRWEARYSAPGQKLNRPASPLLARWVPPAQPDQHALELACGLGHNALWLAEQGYSVTAVDISYEALRRARAEMLRRQIAGVLFVQADLDHFPLPGAAYDVVSVFRFLDRRLFPAIRACLRPGGLIIYETFNTGQLKRMPDSNPEHMLRAGELAQYFPGWRVLENCEGEFTSSFVGQKPENA